ncbi:hypothetical protein [Leptospira santarosai]|uniref:hypothetical protein n=2 Tax=Leptospira santarosai TaxID=28183 RepID=UPI000772FF95|nr:hypothetical protein [Leptospira santarosai]MBW9232142.1 hypothetical protein [Leptospira santarosai]MDI7166594.1 hypothetical protein [Leptospira santarosai]MDI7172554.1 hypothetical protein [Leptospira santarosai]MDI7194308.1 hypothetical protein [Leptospira santarosai]MDI7215351.1 hypothetical protein [Leptospira santarosai]
MAFSFKNLDAATRAEMRKEIQSDIDSKKIYISPRLNSTGVTKYPELLIESAENYDEVWLAKQIKSLNLLNLTEIKKTPKGGTTTASIPVIANETLAEGEFNRYYARALCLIASSISGTVKVYRAKQVLNARSESEQRIGQTFDPNLLLNDLRNSIGVDTALKLPSGPNSGLSIYLD